MVLFRRSKRFDYWWINQRKTDYFLIIEGPELGAVPPTPQNSAFELLRNWIYHKLIKIKYLKFVVVLKISLSLIMFSHFETAIILETWGFEPTPSKGQRI